MIELILYSNVKIALIFLPAIRLKATRHPRRRGKEKLFDIFDYYLMTCVHSNSITNCHKLSWRQQQSCSFIFSRFNINSLSRDSYLGCHLVPIVSPPTPAPAPFDTLMRMIRKHSKNLKLIKHLMFNDNLTFLPTF